MLLNDVKVLDLSRLVAGNQLTSLLADFGADVVKVERAGHGDPLRNWTVKGVDTHWKVYARNKRSIAMDIRDADHFDVVKRLINRSDVIVDSFKPGDMDRFGLSDKVLHELNPSLLIVHVSGWGRTGSRSTMPGFGTLIEAASGMASRTGDPEGPPQLPPGSFADMVAGTYGAFAVAAALVNRSSRPNSGGDVIDLSLFEPLFAIMGPQAADFELTGEAPQRTGSRVPSTAPRNVYLSSDGAWVALSGSTQAMTDRLFEAMDRPDMSSDPKFSTNTARLENVEELDSIIGAYFAERTRDDALAELQAKGVTVGAVATIEDLISSEYFDSRAVLRRGPDVDNPEGTLMHDVVPRLKNNPGTIRTSAPQIGEHTREVLREVCTDAEVERFLSQER